MTNNTTTNNTIKNSPSGGRGALPLGGRGTLPFDGGGARWGTRWASTFFGNVDWYRQIANAEGDVIYIDATERYVKQTERNHCNIATANGVQKLTVPVTIPEGATSIRDILVSDHGNWRHQHWEALKSAYGMSPFFEYYQDDIRPFFEKQDSPTPGNDWHYLLDFNTAITQKMLELLGINKEIKLITDKEELITDKEELIDTKELKSTDTNEIKPTTNSDLEVTTTNSAPEVTTNNKQPPVLKTPPSGVGGLCPSGAGGPGFLYYQTFQRRHGFIPGLSILDLLFNEGPESIIKLTK